MATITRQPPTVSEGKPGRPLGPLIAVLTRLGILPAEYVPPKAESTAPDPPRQQTRQSAADLPALNNFLAPRCVEDGVLNTVRAFDAAGPVYFLSLSPSLSESESESESESPSSHSMLL